MWEVAEQAQRVAFVCVDAAARFLGISRGMAYQQAHEHLDHGGGLRCVRLGHPAAGAGVLARAARQHHLRRHRAGFAVLSPVTVLAVFYRWLLPSGPSGVKGRSGRRIAPAPGPAVWGAGLRSWPLTPVDARRRRAGKWRRTSPSPPRSDQSLTGLFGSAASRPSQGAA